MKKTAVKARQEAERDEVLAAAERTRQQCNKLTEREMKLLRQKALAIIYGPNAKAPTGGR